MMVAFAHGQARTGTGSLPLPTVSAITSTSFTLSWTTSQALNTQVWYGPHATTPHLTSRISDWKLVNNHTMVVTGLVAGTTWDVQVESSNFSNPDLVSPVFTVTTTPASGKILQIAPTASNLQPGQTQQFTASYSDGSPATGITWAANNGGGISSSGLFTASAAGTFIVTATDSSGMNATASVNVQTAPASGLPLPAISNITATSFTLTWQTAQALNTQVHYTLQGSTTSTSYADWKLVTSHSAVITGLQPDATYTVVAESSNFSNPDLLSPSFNVTLGSGPPSRTLGITPTSVVLQVGQTQQFTASYSDNTVPTGLNWSATNGGQISSTGMFTASGAGTFLITVTDSTGMSAEASVTVQSPAPTGLPLPAVSKITATSFTLNWQTTQRLNTQVHYTLQGSTSTTNYANWTLVTSHTATISGLQPDATYTVVAESSYFSNPDLLSPSFTVTLGSASATLSLAPSPVTLQVGQTQQFTASYSDGSPLGPLTWSDSGGGTISASGLFSATTTGAWTVTATDSSGRKASASITVQSSTPTLLITPGNAVLIQGSQATFTATYSNGSSATVSWSSTNGGSISPSGTFDASTAGSYLISATDSTGNTAMANVRVEAPSAPSPATTCPGCFFTSPQAAWLYAGSTPSWGTGFDLSALSVNWQVPGFTNNASGFGMPVQHTQELDGFTSINDYNYGPGWRHDSANVPNPPGNQWTPSCGWRPPNQYGATACYGAYDGKDFIIDDTNGNFYEIDQLYVDTSGHPINYGADGYGTGPCGATGETACGIRGIFSGNLATSAPNLGGSTAAGIVSGAGVIVPGELECATCLNHMVQIVITRALNNSVTCNAFPTGKTGDGAATLPNAVLCEGGILQYTGDWTQLDPATHSVAVIALARALQLYGAMIVDQGGNETGPGGFSFYTDYDTPPDLTGIGDLRNHLAVFYGTAQLAAAPAP